jgi:hypothetical protein
MLHSEAWHHGRLAHRDIQNINCWLYGSKMGISKGFYRINVAILLNSTG